MCHGCLGDKAGYRLALIPHNYGYVYVPMLTIYLCLTFALAQGGHVLESCGCLL